MVNILLSFLSVGALFCSSVQDVDSDPVRVSLTIEDVYTGMSGKKRTVLNTVHIDEALHVKNIRQHVCINPVQRMNTLRNVRIDAPQVAKILTGKIFHIEDACGQEVSTKSATDVLRDAVSSARFHGKARFFSLALDIIADYVVMTASLFSGPRISRLWHFSDKYFMEEEMLEEKPEKVIVCIDDVEVYGKPLESVLLGRRDDPGDVCDVQGLYLVRRPYQDNTDTFDFMSATNHWMRDA